ncbi:hypothetical protein GCM10028773_40940 [Spirosoma koreense]
MPNQNRLIDVVIYQKLVQVSGHTLVILVIAMGRLSVISLIEGEYAVTLGGNGFADRQPVVGRTKQTMQDDKRWTGFANLTEE